MPFKSSAIAIDLGAETGRVMLGAFDRDRLTLHEAHRFPTATVAGPSGLHWDIPAIQNGIQNGIRRARSIAEQTNTAIQSIAVDTWGVDYALLDANRRMLELPHAYRDPRNGPAFERTCSIIAPATLFARTGIQLMPVNTLFQLAAARGAEPTLLEAARRLVFMPDLFREWLASSADAESGAPTGVEATIASTSQLLDAATSTWATDLLASLDIPTHFLGSILASGTVTGTLAPQFATTAENSAPIAVLAIAGHDTACAVAAVPASAESEWCFISSGTWSLMGAEISTPCITEFARLAPFTNEAGVDGTTRFLKNMTGLWLLQQCRMSMTGPNGPPTYDDLTQAARGAAAFRTLIDPERPEFSDAGDMPQRIAAFARRTGQPEPANAGELARCCFDSLALAYARTLTQLEQALNRRFDVIHVVGGGSRNALLNQSTADACARTVIAGPAEATTIGNLLLQRHAMGSVSDLHQLREIVTRSFDPVRFEPAQSPALVDARSRFATLAG